MSTATSYGERLIESILRQCARRGIPPEEEGSFLAHIEKVTETPFHQMTERQLIKVQQGLDALFVDYLEGVPERTQPATGGVGPWPENVDPRAAITAVRAGINIRSISGTGKDGKVTLKDVKEAIKAKEGGEAPAE